MLFTDNNFLAYFSLVFVDMDMALDHLVPESLDWAHTDEGPESVHSITAVSGANAALMPVIREYQWSQRIRRLCTDLHIFQRFAHQGFSCGLFDLDAHHCRASESRHMAGSASCTSSSIHASHSNTTAGIYLTEFRHRAHTRQIVATIL